MTDIQDPVGSAGRSLTRRVGRGILLVLSVLLATTAIVVLLSAILMSVFDSAEQWQAWRTDHYWPLFTWRLILYVSLVIAWIKLKERWTQSKQTDARKLRRLEIMVILLFVMIELSKAFIPSGGIQ
ncbi:hypothetical protein GIW56_25090 [Pseudomonas gessardii]|uniref:Uncharacterized protein n=1 Tax=Pseudomonas gessardii TaxID=78544 RepID=A0ABS9FFD4_9PSED|nr:hypothetical protein [Pseudomonas gessardii]MCF4992048.1 hypothetical protein [Pseudomonas gessardii]MCF5096892.1 hypothetical protein [Pseudomonas gessardii]MCF5110092.1 hypothetical protein [Pseudomonas gessardii]